MQCTSFVLITSGHLFQHKAAAEAPQRVHPNAVPHIRGVSRAHGAPQFVYLMLYSYFYGFYSSILVFMFVGQFRGSRRCYREAFL
jgi:hypothetical protein